MKKIIITLALAVATAFAANAQVQIGAGFASDKQITNYGSSETSGTLNGFYAGVGYDLALPNDVYFTPGIYYNFMTASETYPFGSLVKSTGTTTEHNLLIPMKFNYGVDFDSARIFVSAGPSFLVGLASTYKDKSSIAGYTSTATVDQYGDNSNYGRFNVFLSVGLGVDICDMFRVTVGYDYGFLDRSKDSNVTMRDRIFHAGVAFLF